MTYTGLQSLAVQLLVGTCVMTGGVGVTTWVQSPTTSAIVVKADQKVGPKQWTSSRFGGESRSRKQDACASISDRVDALRSLTGLSAEQLARLFGVSRRSVNNWLSGKPMTFDHQVRLEKLEAALFRLNDLNVQQRKMELFAAGINGEQSLFTRLAAESRDPQPLQGVGASAQDQLL